MAEANALGLGLAVDPLALAAGPLASLVASAAPAMAVVAMVMAAATATATVMATAAVQARAREKVVEWATQSPAARPTGTHRA